MILFVGIPVPVPRLGRLWLPGMVFRFRALPVAADAEVRDERLCALCCIIQVLFRTRDVHIGVYILYSIIYIILLIYIYVCTGMYTVLLYRYIIIRSTARGFVYLRIIIQCRYRQYRYCTVLIPGAGIIPV
jgi:hypothetical protein